MNLQRAFGLIELLVGVVLAGILASIAVPTFAELIQAQQRRDAANQLAHSLRSARTEALLRSQTMWVEAIDDDWSRGWQIRPGPHEEADLLLAERARNGKPRIVGNSKVMNRLGFSAQGTPLDIGNGTLYMCMRGSAMSHYRVIVASNGRVRVDDGKSQQQLCS